MTRTGWLAIIMLLLLSGGAARQLFWPSQTPRLECPPSQVRTRPDGVSSCEPSAGSRPLQAAQLLGVGGRLDLNRATEEELALLDGVGPSLARALSAARPDGGFGSWEQVDAVSGIGPSKLKTLQRFTDIR